MVKGLFVALLWLVVASFMGIEVRAFASVAADAGIPLGLVVHWVPKLAGVVGLAAAPVLVAGFIRSLVVDIRNIRRRNRRPSLSRPAAAAFFADLEARRRLEKSGI